MLLLLLVAFVQRLAGLLAFVALSEHFGHEEADFACNNKFLYGRHGISCATVWVYGLPNGKGRGVAGLR